MAAANCARWLREEGGEGSILLVGREPDPPYNRPPLSKGYLQGKETREDVLFRPDEWWDEQGIERLQRTSVMKLDTAERVATLSTKEEIEFGNGAARHGGEREAAAGGRLRPRRDPLPARLRQLGRDQGRGASRKRAVLIGGSYIGCEVAASLTAAHGVDCTIVMMEDVTFEGFFGERGRALLPGRARGARGDRARRPGARALRGRRRARDQGRHEERARARVRLRGGLGSA